MHKLIISLFLLTTVLSCTGGGNNSDGSTNSKATMVDMAGLTGKVKHYETYDYDCYEGTNLIHRAIYDYDQRGNVTEMKQYDGNGLLAYKYTYFYDGAGNIIEENKFYSEDEIAAKIQYAYDQHGNVLSEKEFNSKMEPGNENTYRYTYNARSNLTQVEQFSAGGTLNYKIGYQYDEQNRRTEEHWDVVRLSAIDASNTIKRGVSNIIETYRTESIYDIDGSRGDYYYDKNGDINVKKSYDAKNNLVEVESKRGRVQYTFDDNGRIVGQQEITESMKPTNEAEYSYNFDDHSNLTESFIVTRDGETNSRWAYRYDDKNNLLEQAFYNEEGRLTFWKVFKYEYWN